MKIFPILQGLRKLALSLILLPGLAEAADQELSYRDYPGPTLSGAIYGAAMACSGDWLAVGAPGTGINYQVGDSVILWKREAGLWKVRQVLSWPYANPTAVRNFGHALAMDGARLLVSTLLADTVLAYRLEADVWVLDGELKPQGTGSTAVGFGTAIALQGDVAVVGSPTGTVGLQTGAGWVDVFQRQTSGWVHQTRLADAAPRSSAALGRSLAMHGDFIFTGIFNHDLPSLNRAGKVVVFQKSGGTWAWSRDLLARAPLAGGWFGYTVKVAEGRLFVSASNVGAVDAGMIFEYSIQGGWGLVSQTSANGLHAASADLLVTQAPAGVREIRFLRRQSDQSWAIDGKIGFQSLFGLRSALVKDGDVLIGSNADLTPDSSGSQGVNNGMVNWLLKQPDGSWGHGEPLVLMSADRLRGAEFGHSIAVSDTWLVVGAPEGYYGTDDGLVFTYRKSSDGRWVFHSVLPNTVAPETNPHFFGARVVISGDRIVVGSSDEGNYWSTSRVFTYLYDPVSDSWKKEAVIQSPSGKSVSKFGIKLALEGTLLAVSPDMYGLDLVSDYVALYRKSALGWELETVLDVYTRAFTIHGGRLVVGAASGKEVYVYEKKAAGWVETARLLPPKLSGFDEFGSHVSISGTRIMVGCGPKSASVAVPFELVGSEWQRKTPLMKPSPWDSNSIWDSNVTSTLLDSVAVFKNGNQTALYVLHQGKWIEARSSLPVRSSVHSVGLQGGQVLTGSGTSSVWVQDLVKAPGFQVASDYPQVDGASISTFDAGEYVVGTEVAGLAVIKAFPLGVAPVSVDVNLSGDTAEFTLSQTQFEVGINQEIQTRLSFKPLTVGTRELRVTFSPDMPGALPQTFAFRVRVVAEKVPLQFTQQPASGFVFPIGNLETLESQVTGTRPWSFRWFKDGRPLPSAHSRSLTLAPKSAGRYHVEVTNAAGTIRSQDSLIGFFEVKTSEVVVQPGGTARMEVSATGPGIQIQWEIYKNEEWVPLTDKEGISGSRTPVLTVRNARQSTTYRAYLTCPTPQGIEAEEAACNLHVVQPPVVQFEGQQLTRGEPFAKGIEVLFEGPYLSGPVVRVSGLPPGLTATPEGYIEGTPTRTGSYRVTITVTISGVTGSRVVGLSVTEAGLPPPGIYWGWFDEIDGQPQRYAVVADLQPSGALSAVVHLGEERHPLAGLLEAGTGWRSRRKLLPYWLGENPQQFWLSASPGRENLYLNAVAPGGDEAGALQLSELRLIKPSVLSEVPASLGNHNLGLIFDPVRVGGPEGHGYGLLTVSSDHRVTYVNQMPDGSSLTGSSWLSSPSLEESGTSRFYLYQADAASRNRLYGAARFTSDVDDPESITPEYLEWQKLPGKGRLFAEGFDPVPLTFLTSRPHSVSSRLMQPGGEHSLTISGPEIYLEKIRFHVSPQRQPLFDPGLINPAQARFKFFAPLSLFVGQFTLRDPDPLNLQRTLTRQVQFFGMLLPEHGIGVGSFRLPSLPDKLAEPPTTLQTSPIHPGAVKIELSSPTDS